MCLYNAQQNQTISSITVVIRTENKSKKQTNKKTKPDNSLLFFSEFIIIQLEVLHYKNNEKRLWFMMAM